MGCALHKEHRPPALTTELHHVIPRAWQATWAPPTAPFPGTYAGQRLWDARTVELAPTCHRNVHALIVRVMHAAARASSDAPWSEATIKVAGHHAELDVAT